jgi:multiple sugar transport system permease protein
MAAVAETGHTGRTHPPGEKPPSRLGRVWFYALLLLLTAVFVAPTVWMVVTSLKSNYEATHSFSWIPTFKTEGYDALLNTDSSTPVLRWFFNSVVVAAGQTLLILVSASMAAYALARMEFPFKNLLFALIVSTLFVPPLVLIIPNYVIMDQLGWIDTLWAIMVPGAASAFGVFFLRQFFLLLPVELEEAALIDGANRIQIFYRVILPLSKPALATLAMLSFLVSWNDFIWPIYVLLNPPNFTLPAGLAILQNANNVNYAIIMAGAVVASVPVLVLYLFAQRYVIEGVSRAGLKG